MNTWLINDLLNKGLINDAVYDTLTSYVKKTGKSELHALSSMELLEDIKILKIVAARIAIQYVLLRDVAVPPMALAGLSAKKLSSFPAIPFGFHSTDEKTLSVAMTDPTDMAAIDELSLLTGRRIIPYVCSKKDVLNAIDKCFPDSQNTYRETDSAAASDNLEASAINIVNDILTHAVRENASDIHIEALSDAVRVRYRIDGILYERHKYPSTVLNSVIARIKILGDLDIAEKRNPQSGRFSQRVDSDEYDIRVSSTPTLFGEKCVMRIAPKTIFISSKRDLGLLDADIIKFDSLFKRRHGVVLVTGPTGCGKTTTLYSVLSELNSPEKNIITVEDPIEASIEGINQTQVNTRAGLMFSSALRSMLRQDPDIIMVGEIRDEETAKMVVQASITGHLVISTLHTNSSVGSITRLLNMGIESYLLADALTGVVAQRLVRRLCADCREQYEPSPFETETLNINKGTLLYRAKGCEKCGGTGYRGRIGVYEILEITDSLKKIINERTFDTEQLYVHAHNEGMKTLFDNACTLVSGGITAFDEIIKMDLDRS